MLPRSRFASIVLLALAAAASGCCSRTSAPRAAVLTIDYYALLGIVEGDDPEARYQAILELRRFDRPEVRAHLRHLATMSDEILTRNAAARVLADLGEREAAATLVANLHQDNKTHAVTDAIHHLRALFGTDRGYDANRGYTAQAEARARWVAWLDALDLQGVVVLASAQHASTEEARQLEARFERLHPQVEAFIDTDPPEDRKAAWSETLALWKALGELQPSREPRHVALVARAFGEMSRRWPTDPSLANNHALAALAAGDPAASEASYRRALELAPEEAYFHNDYGILLEGLGRLVEAEARYREAIRLKPDEGTWWSNLADVLRKRGRTEEAVRAYREAEPRMPERWYDHRLWIRRLRGPDAEATRR